MKGVVVIIFWQHIQCLRMIQIKIPKCNHWKVYFDFVSMNLYDFSLIVCLNTAPLSIFWDSGNWSKAESLAVQYQTDPT